MRSVKIISIALIYIITIKSYSYQGKYHWGALTTSVITIFLPSEMDVTFYSYKSRLSLKYIPAYCWKG
ncbi:hypothetical protein EZJ58_0738 [Sodalis ligni]|uniref:Uncharacterized protein n=1 Tax=Sodalis ligni TaxID=2697027 RepID=A0A4V2Q2F8_9GAMM|nr:hypothetical protein EZJ58_0738 [Sodalis ligni]